MSNIAPCKDCNNRKVTDTYNCHSNCTEYKKFLEEKHYETINQRNDSFQYSIFLESLSRLKKQKSKSGK